MSAQLSPNYYELFGLPVSFDVDQGLLAERYRELQRTVHPDRFASASDRERLLSVQRAAQINEGYETLRRPLSRARYLLELRGVEVDSQQDTTLDTEFLMSQMELRERLAEVRHQPDAFVALSGLLADIDAQARDLTARLSAAFVAGSDADLRQAKETVHKLQFLRRLREEAEELEEELINAG